MRKSVLYPALLSAFIIFPVLSGAEPLEISGVLSGALLRQTFTDAYGVSNSVTPLNLYLKAFSPLPYGRVVSLSAMQEKSEIVLPTQKNGIGLGFAQNSFPFLSGKRGGLNAGYNFTDYREKTNPAQDTTYKAGEFNLGTNVFVADNANLRLGYNSYDKNSNIDAVTYKSNAVSAGTDIKLRNGRDLLKVDTDIFKKDDKVKASVFNRNTVKSSYTRSLAARKEGTAYLHLRDVNYDTDKNISTRKETGLGLNYVDKKISGPVRFGFDYYQERYPYSTESDFNRIELSRKSTTYRDKKWLSKTNNNEVSYFDVVVKNANDYLQWLWDLEYRKQQKRDRALYIRNGVKARLWQNNNTSAPNQHYLEDIAAAGWEWSSFNNGSFSVGPVLGHRLYIDPNATKNAVTSDDTPLTNPANFLLTGLNATTGMLMTNGNSLNVSYSYRMFYNYAAKPNPFTTEISTLFLSFTRDLAENLSLNCVLSYSDNQNDNGLTTIGLSRMEGLLQLDYKFGKAKGVSL